MKKLGRNRKEEPSGTVVNEEIPQEDQQPGPSQQCNNLAKSSMVRAAMKKKMMVLLS